MFFSLTGISLNHADAFERDEPIEREWSGTIPSLLVAPGLAPEEIDRLEVVEELRGLAGLRGRIKGFEVEADEVFIIAELAGCSTDVSIERASGEFLLLESQLGAWAVVNDLHKVRGTGAAWSLFVDALAVVLLISGATGVWLLGYVKPRRVSGFAVAAMGLLMMGLLYGLLERI